MSTRAGAALLEAPSRSDLISGPEALGELLQELYRRQIASGPRSAYLRQHAEPRCIVNQVLTYQWYEPFLPATGAILDWGCRHAPDACLLRAAHGDRFELHGCDFVAPDACPAFFDYAGLAYTRLEDVVQLPYASGMFHAVIASGTLEHAALDYESLKELYRVLKPGGVLIIGYLPNWLSVQEWRKRALNTRGFHRRRYGLRETQMLLKHAGFYPIEAGYHTFFWQRLLGGIGLRGRANRIGSRLLAAALPGHWFSSTLRFVAKKVSCM